MQPGLTTNAETMLLSARNCVCTFIYTHLSGCHLTYLTGKDKKRVDRTTAQSKEMEGSSTVGPEELRAALDKVRAEEVPKTPEEKEQYFMMQVGMGEQLSTQGVFLKLIHFV